MIRTMYAAAAIALCGMIGAAQAATLNGKFLVSAVNATNQTSAQSEATADNADGAYEKAFNGVAGYAYTSFEYEGDLDFATNNGSGTTIAQWLATGVNGTVTGLDATFGALQLSKGNINNGTATTTFFTFTQGFVTGAANFTVTHDDGFAIYQIGEFDAEEIGGFLGPNTVRTTEVVGFSGGIMELLYVATNSDPSILKVEVSPVPLPAALPLLVAGLAGLGFMRLRRKAA